ncbi:unnamed protein product [Ranitomeya imitator]|uniref:G-protein coupled receptors family 1 profile domain-containing protein n=1 Tax=Ranitomeya imitator TaxID=111125 RepID=A0ABN9L8U6_9NEOB|nr:unnamed protein product [Ranitomeya imitator]
MEKRKKTKELSEDLRNQIVRKHEQSQGYKSISKDLIVPVSTVRSVIKKFKAHGTVANLPRCGRKRKIDKRFQCKIVQMLDKEPRLTSKQVQAACSPRIEKHPEVWDRSMGDVKKRWRSVTDRFMKSLKSPSGSSPPRKRVPYADQLQFILGSRSLRRTESNVYAQTPPDLNEGDTTEDNIGEEVQDCRMGSQDSTGNMSLSGRSPEITDTFGERDIAANTGEFLDSNTTSTSSDAAANSGGGVSRHMGMGAASARPVTLRRAVPKKTKQAQIIENLTSRTLNLLDNSAKQDEQDKFGSLLADCLRPLPRDKQQMYIWRSVMEQLNQTSVKSFILLGLSSIPQLQAIYFLLFLIIYTITLTGNVLLIVVVRINSQLRTPMYFFLSNLSFIDICFSSTVVPKLLVNTLSQDKSISFLGCASQMYFSLALGATECITLAVMAYDRYVAICNPLRYQIIMNKKLPYCKSHHVNHFFCEMPPLFKLSCHDTLFNEVAVYISVSYFHIITTILKIRSTKGRYKAFSTCASHLTVVSLYYGTIMFMYLRPRHSYFPDRDRAIAILYTVVTPMLNPIIYSIRNKDVTGTLRKKLSRKENKADKVCLHWSLSVKTRRGRHRKKMGGPGPDCDTHRTGPLIFDFGGDRLPLSNSRGNKESQE